MTLQMQPEVLAFLDWVESTEQWAAADKHWMDWALGTSLAEYDVDGPHFASIIMDYTLKLREIVQQRHSAGAHEDCADCPLAEELGILVAHMSIMAAIATREVRGKPPIWSLPKPTIDPDSR